MAPQVERTLVCANCRREFTRPVGRGRPSKYCKPACGTASRRKTTEPPDCSAHTALVKEISEDISRGAGDMMSDAYAELSSAELLSHMAVLQRQLEDYEAAVIRRGRARGESWEELSVPLSISPERLRKKWTTDTLDRRLQMRAARTAAEASAAYRAALIPGQRSTRAGSGTRPARGPGAGREPDTGRHDDQPPPTQDPRHQLASALSYLQRASNKTVREIATYAVITPSYVSKILAGSRLPSWPVTQRLAEAYETSADELRPLWEAAHHDRTSTHLPAPAGETPARRFHTALRSLHLAASRPDPWTIRQSSDNVLKVATISRALSGPYVPDWNTTGRLVAALSGRPADIRPLWQAAMTWPPPGLPHHQMGALPASAFG
ncbi:XRE family transcriptional regulator [Streptomyces sp. WAC05374]|uniref:helix-turn-helix domain-containing protein n=1 Tax=Streptomyces sp. WAC05374 TaxID=2487420 RepID=UPI000F885AEF|nr:helix-turn-helix transcriptional regulator [Streptomyces sp. WAC05374]RST16466.1 XRE family transcriptional regulator [Streptomyces sp. WAC05374]TDF54688.1 XRE family transcriptional regulator [Streptomyces sp. WAC05374]TDF56324.1 XRE family transcriptional regulator [Streptomyces sp. WAC05374]